MDAILNHPAFVIWRGKMAERGFHLSDLYEELGTLECTATWTGDNPRADGSLTIVHDLIVRVKGDELVIWDQVEPDDFLQTPKAKGK